MAEITYKLAESAAELEATLALRRRVFVEEQGIAESLVFDDHDAAALHLIVKSGEAVIGTARVRFPRQDQAKIERMAVCPSWRRRGIGRGMMAFLGDEFKRRQVRRVVLDAQYDVAPFYSSVGYRASGPPFQKVGIKHIRMERCFEA